MRKIDAHVHIWNIDKVNYAWPTPADASLYRNIEPDELAPHLHESGIAGAVLVQAADHVEETVYLLKMARQHDCVEGVVGWVPLERPLEAGLLLEQLTRSPHFKGVRHLIHCESDPDWLLRKEVVEGLKVLASFDLAFDVVAVFPNHLRHVPYLAEKVPNLRLVLDHLAKPPIVEGGMEAWITQLEAAAAYPNVFAKMSGLNTACNWSNWNADDWKTSVDAAFKAFGAERLMYGSDWPVANFAGDYRRVWGATLTALSTRSEKEIEAVLGGTAVEFYRL